MQFLVRLKERLCTAYVKDQGQEDETKYKEVVSSSYERP